MTTNSKWIKGNLIFHDGAPNKQRWLQGIGAEVAQFVDTFVNTPFEAADTPGAYTTTLVEAGAGETTVALKAGATGGALLITADANENDGANIQAKGEAFKLTGSNPCYFGVSLQTNDATQTDILVGLTITDTTVLGGVTDGVYFECLDGSTDINFVLEKDSTETTSAAAQGTLADDTDVILEFCYNGTSIDSYVNGTLQTRLATTNLPDDEFLTPTIAFLTGEAVANTCTVNWIRCLQVN